MILRPHHLIGLVSILIACSRGTGASAPVQAATPPDTCATMAANWRPLLSGPWREEIDSSQTVAKPSDASIRYVRARFDVWFADSLSGPDACRLLERYHARVLAGVRGAFGVAGYT